MTEALRQPPVRDEQFEARIDRLEAGVAILMAGAERSAQRAPGGIDLSDAAWATRSERLVRHRWWRLAHKRRVMVKADVAAALADQRRHFHAWAKARIKREGAETGQDVRPGVVESACWAIRIGPFLLKGRADFVLAHYPEPPLAVKKFRDEPTTEAEAA